MKSVAASVRFAIHESILDQIAPDCHVVVVDTPQDSVYLGLRVLVPRGELRCDPLENDEFLFLLLREPDELQAAVLNNETELDGARLLDGRNPRSSAAGMSW